MTIPLPNVRQSPAGAQPCPFGFTPNRERAAVRCSGLVRQRPTCLEAFAPPKPNVGRPTALTHDSGRHVP